MSEPKTFLREHAFTLAAICLPIVVAALFLAASALPKYLVEDPQYRVLLTLDAHTGEPQPYHVRFQIDHGRLAITAKAVPEQRIHDQKELYLFDPLSGKLEHIELVLPTEIEGESMDIPAPERVQNLVFTTGDVAPDGYTFTPSYGNSAGIFGALFGMGNRYPVGSISRNGRVIEIGSSEGDGYRYYYRTAQLLGWTEA